MTHCSAGNRRTKAELRRHGSCTDQTWKKEIPLARRQHAIEAEHSAPEGNGSSRSVRLGVPRRRDKRGRRRTVARAIPRSLSLTKYTINEGGAALGGRGVASLKGERGRTKTRSATSYSCPPLPPQAAAAAPLSAAPPSTHSPNETPNDLLFRGLDVDIRGNAHARRCRIRPPGCDQDSPPPPRRAHRTARSGTVPDEAPAGSPGDHAGDFRSLP